MINSLKLQLFELIKTKGYVSYQEIVDKTNELGYKVDNATKRMRELTTKKNGHIPLVEPVKNEKGVNIGYRYIGTMKIQKVEVKDQKSLFDFTPLPKFKNQYEA